MRIIYTLVFITILTNISFAQDTPNITLPSVVVQAFEQERNLKDVPAAVSFLDSALFNRSGPQSIVAAVNTQAGVRLEERSPGSYRVNIRASSLRSPFGVRNVKVYFNDIPISDPGGHTFLNQLGFYNFRTLEIIKGPASRLYGAGTGGAMLINTMNSNESPGLFAEYSSGSYATHNVYGRMISGPPSNQNLVGYQHQQSNGYRSHSELKRQVFNWSGRYSLRPGTILRTTFLYGNLYYETPGALTLQGFLNDPRAARPGSAVFPGAESANAHIEQKQIIAGASLQQDVTRNIRNRTSLYGMHTSLRNPNIQAYDHSREPHFGGRTVFNFTRPVNNGRFLVDAGAEIQRGTPTVSVYKNNSGKPDSLRSTDDIINTRYMIFLQGIAEIGSWSFSAGGSFNKLNIGMERFSPEPNGLQERDFDNFAPGFSVLKKFGSISIYGAFSKGFSPPTTSELLPTGGDINLQLNAEQGTNYEAGLKGNAGKFFIDLNVFTYRLENTIVQRRTAGGGDYYLNAGSTRQDGIETQVNYSLNHQHLKTGSSLWLSHSYYNFRYRNFVRLTDDYSGNTLPSVSPDNFSTGADLFFRNGISASVIYNYTGRIALNDANDLFTDPSNIVLVKVGYEYRALRTVYNISGGADNLLDQKYSLGNDINGFGGRYFNAAPGRNFFLSVSISRVLRPLQ